MLQLRCTGKVQKELGIKANDLAEVRESDSILGNWYVNVILIDRRKTLLFMNEDTLLSFVLFGLKKSNSHNIPEIFLKGLDQLLTLEGFDIGDIDRVLRGYESYEFTKTVDKKVIGNMVDLADLYKHFILAGGAFKHCDLGMIIHKINRTPQRNLDWSYSIDVARNIVCGKK